MHSEPYVFLSKNSSNLNNLNNENSNDVSIHNEIVINIPSNESFSNESLPEFQVLKEVNMIEKFDLNENFEDVVRNSILKFITYLYSKPNVTATLVQEIV